MAKAKTKSALKALAKRVLLPHHWYGAYKAAKERPSYNRAIEDPQLKLYDRILQTDFLHYGYFDDPNMPPERISLDDLRKAQVRYAQLIVDQIRDDGPVLDVGCGMGGLIRMLLDRNLETSGVTPDRMQARYISEKYPRARLIEARFQKMPLDGYHHHFATIIHSESLQYMNAQTAMERVQKLLQPGGRWIVVDYFRIDEAREKSGHHWTEFQQLLKSNSWRIVHQQDITPNIRPTLAYIHMWGNDIGKAVFEFLSGKLEKKHPGKHYLLHDVLQEWEMQIDRQLAIIDPELFCRQKQYVLLAIERS